MENKCENFFRKELNHSDDITFCYDEGKCPFREKCARNPDYIRDVDIPHSFSIFYIGDN